MTSLRHSSARVVRETCNERDEQNRTKNMAAKFYRAVPLLASSSVLAWPLSDSVDFSTCLSRVDFRGPGRSGPCDAYRKAGGVRKLHRRVHGATEGGQRRQRPLRRGEAIDQPGLVVLTV